MLPEPCKRTVITKWHNFYTSLTNLPVSLPESLSGRDSFVPLAVECSLEIEDRPLDTSGKWFRLPGLKEG